MSDSTSGGAAGRSRQRLRLLAVFCLGVAAGLGLYRLDPFAENRTACFRLERLYPKGGHLINPLLQVEGPPGGDAKLVSLKHRLETYITRCLKQEDASKISVYLRALDKGTWVGVREDETFSAASLAKVPVMIALLMTAQRDSTLLKKTITYDTEIEVPAYQNIAPREHLQVGRTYTVEELLRYMILYSEHVATFLLEREIDQELIAQVYSDVRLPLPQNDANYQISAKDCGRSFPSCIAPAT